MKDFKSTSENVQKIFKDCCVFLFWNIYPPF